MKHLLLAALLLFAATALAQNTNFVSVLASGSDESTVLENKTVGVMDTVLFSLHGQVIKQLTAADNQNLAGISITLKNLETGALVQALTDAHGNYSTWGNRGSYDVEIAYSGLHKILIPHFDLSSGEIRVLNAILAPEH